MITMDRFIRQTKVCSGFPKSLFYRLICIFLTGSERVRQRACARPKEQNVIDDAKYLFFGATPTQVLVVTEALPF